MTMNEKLVRIWKKVELEGTTPAFSEGTEENHETYPIEYTV